MAANIPMSAMLWCLVPVALAGFLFWRWRQNTGELLWASSRMLLQLLAIGYVLTVLFSVNLSWVTLAMIATMTLVASWISIRPVKQQQGVFKPVLSALVVAIGFHLVITVFAVIRAEPWYDPRVVIPLAGMYLANTMNGVSLAMERFFAELSKGQAVLQSRNSAFNAAMIPQVNGLLAVGLVALPGMMTGQILSGVSPLVAVRYQIMIMTMVLGTTVLGVAIALWMISKNRARTDA